LADAAGVAVASGSLVSGAAGVLELELASAPVGEGVAGAVGVSVLVTAGALTVGTVEVAGGSVLVAEAQPTSMASSTPSKRIRCLIAIAFRKRGL
jgi:hypothetical protein